ncbi:MAG: zf-HC2 domain-containing protein [Pseudomonadota bacterium]
MTEKVGLMRRMKGLMLRHMHGMITCREFEAFVLRYIDDELSERERTVFERHLKFCRECREYLAAYRRGIELGQAVLTDDDKPLPNAVPRDLIAAVLDATRR